MKIWNTCSLNAMLQLIFGGTFLIGLVGKEILKVGQTKQSGSFKKPRKTIGAIAETTYDIWRARNDKIFSQKPIHIRLKDSIIHNIVIRSTLNRKLNSHVNATILSID